MSSSLETLTSAGETQIFLYLHTTIYKEKFPCNSGSSYTRSFSGPNKDISLCLQDQEYIENVKEVQVYLDKVKKIVSPGCSQELLNIAVSSMSSVVGILSVMSSKPQPRASL